MQYPQLVTPFQVLRGVLTNEDIHLLKGTYARHAASFALPCYAFLSEQDSPIATKIASLVREAIGYTPYYLNDFFFYTSNTFSTPWHVDTEMFLFKSAINAWILLSPDEIDNPIGFVKDVNSPGSLFYQSIHCNDGVVSFVDLVSSDIFELPASEVENSHVPTPQLKVGDILLLDPKRFHRTNTTIPKGACVFKYVFSDDEAPFLVEHMPESIWPEVGIYKALQPSFSQWSLFMSRVIDEIRVKGASSPLISGFYPENFAHLVARINSLDQEAARSSSDGVDTQRRDDS